MIKEMLERVLNKGRLDEIIFVLLQLRDFKQALNTVITGIVLEQLTSWR
jgi:hypothetical protein